MIARRLVPAFGLLATGCAHYAAVPLARIAPLAAAPAALAGAPPSAAALTTDDVVRLALANNPTLKAQRTLRGVAEAGLVQSGLLPNPNLTGSFLPLISGAGSVPAWSVGLTQDVKALVTYRSRRRAARDAVGQAAADLLWQEWQVAGQARQLAVDLAGTTEQRAVADRLFGILAVRNAVTQRALAEHDVTLVTAAPALSALQAARTSRDALDQRLLQLRHQLNALLGLVPDAPVALAPVQYAAAPNPVAVEAALATLPARRPDLLALRLGYAAQEERVRQAILSQFPDLVLGAAASSDSSQVVNFGPTVGIGLPVFDRSQGAIAVTRATRAQLHAEYDARLATAAGEVAAAVAEIAQLRAQLAIAERDLPAARLAADRAAAARGASAIDEAAFVALITTRFTREQEIMALRLAVLDRQVVVETLLGAGLPQVETLPLTGPAGAGR